MEFTWTGEINSVPDSGGSLLLLLNGLAALLGIKSASRLFRQHSMN
ncbi:MAG: VPDSG-CTERM sorting domain-containing protein [Akkermansiaceae bacterium]|nr:VPDSG-CTERM sorting domain-containing protein [Akkermansiaceae bacterium]